jgi:predicted secreted Zn-dependent protease
MKVNLNWGRKNTSATYRVTGADLDSVSSSLMARDEWGRFESHLPYKWAGDAQGNVNLVTLEPSFTITMPSWPLYRNQPQPCKDEWDTMWRALHKHEDGHRSLFEEGVATIVRKLESLDQLTRGDLDNLMRQTESDIQSKQNKYDTSTDHGRSRGVELTITEQCKAKSKK